MEKMPLILMVAILTLIAAFIFNLGVAIIFGSNFGLVWLTLPELTPEKVDGIKSGVGYGLIIVGICTLIIDYVVLRASRS